MKNLREMSAVGLYYSSRCKDVLKQMEFLEEISEKYFDGDFSKKGIEPRALIVPHSGYNYSGAIASCGFRLLKNCKNVERVIVIGPTHKLNYFQGLSGSFFDSYRTPCGTLKIDKNYLLELSNLFPEIKFSEKVHSEHSTEVQIPFVQKYLPHVKIVELIYGDIDSRILSDIIKYILSKRENLVLISSDLSHYHNVKIANKLDSNCISGIEKLNSRILSMDCEACGMVGIKALINISKEFNLKPTILGYGTSADSTGDESHVIGYLSVAFS